MKKIYISLGLIAACIALQSSVKFSSVPPTGHTGATGDYCTNCHSSYALNGGGGNVNAVGLPTGSYTPGQAYNFSMSITHSAADRKKWGFSITAVNAVGNPVGTFNTANANAAPNGDELSHNTAVTTANSSSYTYNNLTWTAPATPGPDDASVTFYYVGNAANGNGNNQLDYIYSNSKIVALPINLKGFTVEAKEQVVTLKWQTLTEENSKHFIIEKSDDAQNYYSIGTVNAAGNSTQLRNYTFADNDPAYFDKPIFYRLKLVDKDGSFKYSPVQQVKLKATKINIVKAYPNYIKSGSKVNLEIISHVSAILNVQLLDLNGKVLETQQLPVQKGTNNISVSFNAQMAAGMVFAKFSTQDFSQTIRLTSINL